MIESASPHPALRSGQQDGLGGVQDLGRLGHELIPGEQDHRAVGLCRLPRKIERVAYEVGDLPDLGELVIVGEQDGATLLLESMDLVLERHGQSRDPRTTGRLLRSV